MNWAQLHKQIAEQFNEEELRTICFDLGVDYESLGGRGKAANSRELVDLVRRTSRYPDLYSILVRERPSIQWQEEISTYNGFEAIFSTKSNQKLTIVLFSILLLAVVLMIWASQKEHRDYDYTDNNGILISPPPTPIIASPTPFIHGSPELTSETLPELVSTTAVDTQDGALGASEETDQNIRIVQVRASDTDSSFRIEVSIFNPAPVPVILKLLEPFIVMGEECVMETGGAPGPVWYKLAGTITLLPSDSENDLEFAGAVFEDNELKYPYEAEGTIMNDLKKCQLLKFAFSSSLIIPENSIEKFFIEIPKSISVVESNRWDGNEDENIEAQTTPLVNQVMSDVLLKENLQFIKGGGIRVVVDEQNQSSRDWQN